MRATAAIKQIKDATSQLEIILTMEELLDSQPWIHYYDRQNKGVRDWKDMIPYTETIGAIDIAMALRSAVFQFKRISQGVI